MHLPLEQQAGGAKLGAAPAGLAAAQCLPPACDCAGSPPAAGAAAAPTHCLPPSLPAAGRSRRRSSVRLLAMTANAVPTSTSTAPHRVNRPRDASTSTAT